MIVGPFHVGFGASMFSPEAHRFQNMGEAALSFVDLMVNRQAAMIAYIDDFYLMMWMTLAVVPLIPLMSRANLRTPTVPEGERPGPQHAQDLPH